MNLFVKYLLCKNWSPFNMVFSFCHLGKHTWNEELKHWKTVIRLGGVHSGGKAGRCSYGRDRE